MKVKYADDSNNEPPTFYGYKCDHERNVIDSLKYFVDYNDPSLVYVTFVPNGCYDTVRYAKRDNTMSEIKNYFNKNIDSIGVSNEIRLE